MKKINIEADVVCAIYVNTDGEGEVVKTSISELNEQGILDDAVDSVSNCEEVMNAYAELSAAAYRHRAKYPNSKIKITPCYSLQELSEI